MASADSAANHSTDDAVPKPRAKKSVSINDPTKGGTKKAVGFKPPKSVIEKEKTVYRSGRSMKAPRSVAAPPEGSPAGTPGKQRKPHRFRPGTVALREIRRYQKSVDQLIPKKPFERLIREIMQDVIAQSPNTEGKKLQKAAVMALKESAEHYLVGKFQAANLVAVSCKPPTVTLLKRHMELANKLKEGAAGSGN